MTSHVRPRISDELGWVAQHDRSAAARLQAHLIEAVSRPDVAAEVVYAPRIDRLLARCGIRGRLASYLRAHERRFHTTCLVVMAQYLWHDTHVSRGTMLAAKELLALRLDQLADPEQRFILARDMMRLGFERSFQSIVVCPNFTTYILLSATPDTLGHRIDADVVRRAVAAADHDITRRRSSAFALGLDLLGLRPRHPGVSMEEIALIVSAKMWGFAHRHLLAPHEVDRTLHRSDGDCHLVAGTIEGNLLEYFEPDPDYDPASALRDFLSRSLAEARTSQVIEVPRADP